MSIYFIQVGRYFKIGYAGDAQRRFESLHKSGTRYTFPADASWSVEDRELYRVVNGDKGREYWVHIALDNFAVGLEWFLDEAPVRQFIDTLPVEYDRMTREDLPTVPRHGGWCEVDYLCVQHGRGVRETARHAAKRAKQAAA
jgi:hypothetical protein